MRKTLIVMTSAALLSGSFMYVSAADIPELSGWGIRSTTATSPSINLAGDQFFPIVNKLVGTTDFSNLVVTNQAGENFPIETASGINRLVGNMTYKDLYFANIVNGVAPMQISFILQGPMRVGHINFGSGSAKLDSADRQVLNAIANEVKISGLKGVYLVGHADPVGGFAGNMKISYKRAVAAKSYLQSRLTSIGVSDAFLHIEYMGDIQATAPVNKASLKDRRVDVTLYPLI